MEILLTGATGLIGSAIAKNLKLEGISFFTLENSLKEKTSSKVDLITEKLRGNYEIIIHCAAVMPSKENDLNKVAQLNTIIDNNILQNARSNNSRLIYISGTSVYTFDGSKKMNEEENITSFSNKYFEQKYNSERLFLSRLNNTVVLRVSAPYHYEMKANTVLKIFINNALQNKDITYDGYGLREQDFTHVDDISRAVLKTIEKQKIHGIFNIASGKAISMKKLARLIQQKTHNCKSIIKSSGKIDSQEHYKAYIDVTKAKIELGWMAEILIENGIEEWINNSSL